VRDGGNEDSAEEPSLCHAEFSESHNPNEGGK
jgi:hypothetical protein